MITAEILMQIAAEQEAIYKELSIQYPPGTYHEGRNEARDNMDRALLCADWMEKNGHTALRFVGPFGEVDIQKGDQVRVKAGSRFYSTHPKTPIHGDVLKRAQTVTVRSISLGFVSDNAFSQPRITWGGTGGYWRWTDLNNVEFADTYSSPKVEA